MFNYTELNLCNLRQVILIYTAYMAIFEVRFINVLLVYGLIFVAKLILDLLAFAIRVTG